MQALEKLLKLTLLVSLTITTAYADDAAVEVELARQIVIKNISVWDGTSDKAVKDLTVLVEGELITAIESTGELPEGAQVIDGQGGTLIPGIIDAHVHLASPLIGSKAILEDPTYIAALSMKAAGKLLMRGWTTARDIGGPTQGLAKAIDEGLVDGPRIYTSASTITQTSGHGDSRGLNEPHPNMGGQQNYLRNRYSLIADGPDEVRRAVRESLRQGATAIKVMAGGGISSNFDPLDTKQYSVEELRAAVEAAADWNTYVAVHAYTDDAVLRSLEAGVKVIEHGHLLTDKALKQIKADGAFLSSQSFGFVRTLNLPQGTPMAARSAKVMAGTDNMMNTAKKLGIPVAFGTDAFGSMRAYDAAVHEFGYRLRWFDSLEILKQATSHNAKLLELTGPRNPYQKGPLGVIQTGAYADMLIVDGDPLTDITLLEDFEKNIKLIMKGGQIYKNTLAP